MRIDLSIAFVSISRGWWLPKGQSLLVIMFARILVQLTGFARWPRKRLMAMGAICPWGEPALRQYEAVERGGVRLRRYLTCSDVEQFWEQLGLPPRGEFFPGKTRLIPAPEGCGTIDSNGYSYPCEPTWVREEDFLPIVYKLLTGKWSFAYLARCEDACDTYESEENLGKWKEQLAVFLPPVTFVCWSENSQLAYSTEYVIREGRPFYLAGEAYSIQEEEALVVCVPDHPEYRLPEEFQFGQVEVRFSIPAQTQVWVGQISTTTKPCLALRTFQELDDLLVTGDFFEGYKALNHEVFVPWAAISRSKE